jgi:hypothetical protein
MNQYNININEQNRIDEIYEKIEDYANKNFTEEKRKKFFENYLLMINYDYQLGKKMEN